MDCAKEISTCNLILNLVQSSGVEDVVIDDANHIVIVKGQNVDPIRVLGRLQKKFSRNVELISPLPSHKHDNHNIVVPKKKQEVCNSI